MLYLLDCWSYFKYITVFIWELHAGLVNIYFVDLFVFLYSNCVDVMMKTSVSTLSRSCKHRREDHTFSEPWTVADIFEQRTNT